MTELRGLKMQEDRLTDCHIHLDRYPPEEREGVLDRSAEAGVRTLITVGMDAESSAEAVALAQAHERLFAAVGIHPWNAEKAPAGYVEALRRLAQKPRVVALGEVGLDFVDNVFTGVTYHDAPALCSAQERVLRKEIALACELGLPLILHARGAYPALLAVLREERAHRAGGVIHNFDTDSRTAHAFFDLGFSASFGGAVTFPEATALHALVRDVPLERILLETDSPYMPLDQETGEKNEPRNLARIAQRLAALKGIDVREVIEGSFANFAALFRIRADE